MLQTKVKFITIPQDFSLSNAIDFCNQLWKLDDYKKYTFDFNSMGRIEPFTMAYVANEIKRFRKTKSDRIFTALNHERHTYAAHMGFFKAFGLQYGNEPGEASGSSTYIPLTIIHIEDIQQQTKKSDEQVGDIIEKKAAEISVLLLQQESGDLFDTLTFSLREVMRNVVEHSESSFIEYCGQYWPTYNLVEVAILDEGIGVQKTLQENPHLSVNSDRDALYLALFPGVSGKMFPGVNKRANDIWQNSGFGLYMTSRLCRIGGDFFLTSGKAGLLLGNEGKTDFRTSYIGTALRLRIGTENISDLSSKLGEFRKEGFAYAKKYNGKHAIEPSVASTMLARDFKEA